MKRSPNVLLYDPYLSTLGGGERVIFSVAQYWRSVDANITMGAPHLPSTSVLERFGYDTSFPLKQIASGELPDCSARYDVLIYLTNTIPWPTRAPRSYLIVQFPFEHLLAWRHPRGRYRQLRLLRNYESLVYSRYVQRWLRHRWWQSSRILPPPVTQGHLHLAQKRPLILSVGRFFRQDHSKRQDALIEAYKLLPEPIRREWRLVLAGGIKDEHRDYLDFLQRAAQGFQIDFRVNATQDELQDLYMQASLFWHGTGYERGRNMPEKAEHFGMTTIEAMSYGCVPLAYADGGQLEIIDRSFGLLWRSLPELAHETARLVHDRVTRQRQAERAASAAGQYNEATFRRRCAEIFNVE